MSSNQKWHKHVTILIQVQKGILYKMHRKASEEPHDTNAVNPKTIKRCHMKLITMGSAKGSEWYERPWMPHSEENVTAVWACSSEIQKD